MNEVRQRYHQLLDAIEHERAAEEAYYRSLTLQKKLQDRVSSGLTWYPVQINKRHYTVGELVEIEVERTKHTGQSHKLRAGAGCDLFVNGEETVRFKGVISYVRRDRMGIIFSSQVFDKDQIPDHRHMGVELVYDERPYKVMRTAIEEVMSSKDQAIAALRDGIATPTTLDQVHRNADQPYSISPSVNPSQRQAITQALQAGSISIIHGPPGTGKTTTVCALVQALTQHERQVLVCAPSNNAVDLLAAQLHNLGLRVLRVGNVSRISDETAHLSIDQQASDHKDWQHIKKIRIEAQEARRMAGTYKRKFGKQEAHNRSAMYKEARELRKWAKDLEQRLITDIVDNAQVIATTLVGASHQQLEGLRVETVVIDEASQATEPECWNAMLKAHRVILAGDHHQLPPTVKSKDAQALGLDHTLLDLLADKVRYTHRLGVQYRMNDALLAFPNKAFYGGKLLSHEGNRNQQIDDGQPSVIWIDTCGCGFEEQTSPEHKSRWNEGEFFVIREHLLANMDTYRPLSIGLVSPYSQQVRYMRRVVEEEESLRGLDLKIDTIDAFQGQERDLIILSLVRSNDTQTMGFLADVRRLNVAITRSRYRLVIVGDSATVGVHPTYGHFVDHIEQHGLYQSAWEYMSG